MIQGYAQTAEPISSQYVAAKTRLPLSTATIRNDLAELESDGLIEQPHTSAGRIPTIKGIEYYLQHLVAPRELSDADHQRLRKTFSHEGVRGIAKEAANYCSAAALVARNGNDFYYTGFSQLFANPEFEDRRLLHTIGSIIDHLETQLPKIANRVSAKPQVLLGSKNPLGDQCALTLMVGTHTTRTLFGLLSPVRTNYPRTLGFMQALATYL